MTTKAKAQTGTSEEEWKGKNKGESKINGAEYQEIDAIISLIGRKWKIASCSWISSLERRAFSVSHGRCAENLEGKSKQLRSVLL